MTEPAHYKRGPSGSHRWLICTASPEAEEGYPDETSDAADEGTAAHYLLEQCLKAGQSVEEWLEPLTRQGPATITAGQETGCVKDWPVTGEMIEAVQLCIDEVEKHSKKRGTKLFVEERVFVSPNFGLQDTVGGTADIIMYLPKSKTLIIIDFKYGRGHVVEVDDKRWGINPQIGLYVIATLNELERLLGKKAEVKWVVAGVVQPRAYHKKGPVRTKKLHPHQLMGLEIDLIEAVNGTKQRVAGPHCHFCRAKGDCEEYHQWRHDNAIEGFEAEPESQLLDGELPVEPGNKLRTVAQQAEVPVLQDVASLIARPVKGLTLKELGQARQAVATLKAWAAEVETEVKARLLHDLQVPNAKLAKGKGSRAYGGDEAEVEVAAWATADELAISVNSLYQPLQLKSPAQLEKELGKTTFKATSLAKLVTYTEGGPVVVDADSDKPAYVKDNGFKAEAEIIVESPLL